MTVNMDSPTKMQNSFMGNSELRIVQGNPYQNEWEALGTIDESFEKEKIPEHEDIQIRAILYDDTVFDEIDQDQDRFA
jgi:hypothetical protein